MAGDIRVEVERSIEWWRPFVQWLLSVPHLLLSGALTLASIAVALVIGIAVLATGRVPRRLAAFQVLTLRERVRCYTYFFLLRRTAPPFATRVANVDPGDDPLVTVTIVPPATAPRGSILRVFMVAGHLAVLLPIGVVMDACYGLWAVVAAANRGWPPGFERFLVCVERWVLAVAMYLLMVSNEPPRFGVQAYADEAVAPAQA